MLTPITCLILICDGCGAHGTDTEQGAPCHFTTETDAREWLALDPHAAPEDTPDRWQFNPDGTHLCPTCQCAAGGHVLPHPDDWTWIADDDGFVPCLRCFAWIRPRIVPGPRIPQQTR